MCFSDPMFSIDAAPSGTPAVAQPARPIAELRFQDRFVRALPADAATDNRSRAVHGACYSRVEPTPVAAPRFLALTPEVAQLLDLSLEETPELCAALSGNRVLPGMLPYAACYGGHQFGTWAGQLGDGRAITLAEIVNQHGESYELQLKGAGPTPYSRRADGRAVLRSSLREFICSEAMHHLGVPTTRALSLMLTGDDVVRDMFYDGRPALEPGAIVSRVAPSFLRFGNFEIHAARKDFDALRQLVRFTLETHFPEYVADGSLQIAGFFAEVCRRTARLMVEWMRVGFVHGVMNTDNMSILGLTIDYGPYGWLDAFDPDWTPNTTDAGQRRYRYGNQPAVAHWNLAQFARALAPLLDDVEPLQRALNDYAQDLASAQRRMWLAKLGLAAPQAASESEDPLLSEMFAVLVAQETDMTLFFRALAELAPSQLASSADARFHGLSEAFYAPEVLTSQQRAGLDRWLLNYLERVQAEAGADAERQRRMHAVNPLYVPRNYLVHEVIEQSRSGDRQPLAELLEVLRHPYAVQPGRDAYAAKRPEWARHRPGCSMLSCSS
jgi:uncharacterized protein YdiU (UPF0061 family)